VEHFDVAVCGIHRHLLWAMSGISLALTGIMVLVLN
jgi:hypothetical protein